MEWINLCRSYSSVVKSNAKAKNNGKIEFVLRKRAKQGKKTRKGDSLKSVYTWNLLFTF